MGIGESDEGNFERMRSIMSLKNWRNKLASDCQVCHAGDELEGLQWSIEIKVSQVCEDFFKHNFCVKLYVPREPRRDPINRRVNEHGIYIRHCQESNSQPDPSQAGADTTRPQ